MGLFSFLERAKLVNELHAEVENLKRQVDLVTIKEKYVEDHSAVNSIDDIPTNVFSRVYEGKDGWQYEILQGGGVSIRQDYHPNKEGFVQMTEEEATVISNKIVKRMRETEYDNN